MDLKKARSYLKQHGWLANTPSAFADALLARCTFGTAERGQCPYQLGNPTDGLRGIVSGGFAFEIAPHERGPHLAHIFRPGFWFGELELFAGVPKIAMITATRPSVFLHLDQQAFTDLVTENPGAWRWIGLLASQHLELALGVIDDGSLREPGRRIAALLLRLADVRNCDNPHDPRPELDITQSDLAHLATVSRATIVAHLDELEQLGLIARSYGRLTLVDPAALRARVVDYAEG